MELSSTSIREISCSLARTWETLKKLFAQAVEREIREMSSEESRNRGVRGGNLSGKICQADAFRGRGHSSGDEKLRGILFNIVSEQGKLPNHCREIIFVMSFSSSSRGRGKMRERRNGSCGG
jgi:hypothetical protein